MIPLLLFIRELDIKKNRINSHRKYGLNWLKIGNITALAQQLLGGSQWLKTRQKKTPKMEG
jgi:hypothetical protein